MQELVNWIKTNQTLAIVIAAVVVALIVIGIVIAIVNGKKKKARIASQTVQSGERKEDPIGSPAQEGVTSDQKAEEAVLSVGDDVVIQSGAEGSVKENPADAIADTAQTEEAAVVSTVAEKNEESAQEVTSQPIVNEKAEEGALSDVNETQSKNASNGNTVVAAESSASVPQESAAEVAADQAPVKESPKKNVSKTTKGKKEDSAKKAEEKKPVVKKAQPAVEQPSPAQENAADEDPEKVVKRNTGKWTIYKKGEDEYVAYLYANNGKILLTSEVYASEKGAISGISTIKRNAQNGNFEVHCDKNGNYYYKLKSASNKLLCVGEVYPSRVSCENSVDSVRKFSESAILSDEVIEDMTIIQYQPTEELKSEGTKGKWKIELRDDMYIAYLYANNGQLLLVSESYSTPVNARNAMNNIIKNAAACNFIIDRDKNGKYYYKLRNAQKSILCVGETYKTQAACESAIDSVRRFCQTSELVEEAETESEA